MWKSFKEAHAHYRGENNIHYRDENNTGYFAGNCTRWSDEFMRYYGHSERDRQLGVNAVKRLEKAVREYRKKIK